jgi:hypothetical protein
VNDCAREADRPVDTELEKLGHEGVDERDAAKV